jgi:hypothetical protein
MGMLSRNISSCLKCLGFNPLFVVINFIWFFCKGQIIVDASGFFVYICSNFCHEKVLYAHP